MTPAKRQRIYDRDNFTCVYCGEPLTAETATIDHIVPRVQVKINNELADKGRLSAGQLLEPNLESNLAACCYRCNLEKGDYSLEQYRSRLSQQSGVYHTFYFENMDQSLAVTPPPPLTPEQQAEQVRQFDSVFPDVAKMKAAVQACGVTADEALNAHRVVLKKLSAPMLIPEPLHESILLSPAAALNSQVDEAIVMALQKYLPVSTVNDVLQYKARLSISQQNNATTYWLDDIQLITVYPVQSDIVVDNNGAKVTFGQRIVTH